MQNYSSVHFTSEFHSKIRPASSLTVTAVGSLVTSTMFCADELLGQCCYRELHDAAGILPISKVQLVGFRDGSFILWELWWVLNLTWEFVGKTSLIQCWWIHMMMILSCAPMIIEESKEEALLCLYIFCFWRSSQSLTRFRFICEYHQVRLVSFGTGGRVY